MKVHIGVNAGSGCVHSLETTAANVHDITMASRLLREDDGVAYGDSGYLEFTAVCSGRTSSVYIAEYGG